MSFEFNQDDARLNKFPNPFKFENIFLAIGATALLAGGVAVLLQTRKFLDLRQDGVAVAAIALAALVLGLGTKLLIQTLSQLRFYVGRNFPQGLANELAVAGTGAAEGAKEILEALRRQAIEFPESKGALNGILYSLIKTLATSPAEVQAAATQHFRTLVSNCSLLVSLLVSYVMFAGTAYQGFASWLYLPMSGLSLVTAFMQPDRFALDSRSSEDLAGATNDPALKLICLVVFAILAPVLIPRFAPNLAIVPMWTPAILLLAGSIVSSGLIFAAVTSQQDSPSSTSVSCEQATISMNCPPAQLWSAIGRDLQCQWENGRPNRTYVDVPPHVSPGERGSFTGLLLEETQPLPINTLPRSTWAGTLGTPFTRYLAFLGVWGVLMCASCAWVAMKSAEKFGHISRMEMSHSALAVIALAMVTSLSFRGGHLLWSRIQFRSRLVWVETSGVFQRSEISVGNRLRGEVQSSSTLTRVEDATLRIWVAEITSVAFGKEPKRSVVAMAAAPDIAKSITDSLVEFATSQCVVATPTSNQDFARASKVATLGQSLRAGEAQYLQV